MQQASRTTPKLILCIDDDDSLLKLLQTYLESFGYSVLAQADARAGLCLAAECAIDAAVLDCAMPDLNGTYCAGEIRRVRPSARIIMFSGSQVGSSDRLLRLIDAFVQKSDGVPALIPILENLLKAAPPAPALVRRFPRFPVRLPVTLRRSKRTDVLRGLASSIGEGGLGSTVTGELRAGETVHIDISEPSLSTLRPYAEVRYRNGEFYGFQFLNLSALQQQDLRRYCQQLASA